MVVFEGRMPWQVPSWSIEQPVVARFPVTETVA